MRDAIKAIEGTTFHRPILHHCGSMQTTTPHKGSVSVCQVCPISSVRVDHLAMSTLWSAPRNLSIAAFIAHLGTHLLAHGTDHYWPRYSLRGVK